MTYEGHFRITLAPGCFFTNNAYGATISGGPVSPLGYRWLGDSQRSNDSAGTGMPKTNLDRHAAHAIAAYLAGMSTG